MSKTRRRKLQLYINLKLASSGQPIVAGDNEEFLNTAQDLLKSYREKNRLLTDYYCPSDQTDPVIPRALSVRIA